jgi:hypothetical protein
MHAQKVRAMFDKGQKGRAGHWVRMALHVARTRRGEWHCVIAQGAHGIACREVAQRSMQFDRHVARSNVECPSGPTVDVWDISLFTSDHDAGCLLATPCRRRVLAFKL